MADNKKRKMFEFMGFGGRSRSQMRQDLNLGIIGVDSSKNSSNVYRDPKLETYDSYYENRQYDSLPSWDQPSRSGEHLSPRQKKPRIQVAFAKTLSQRLTAKLVGSSVFPTLNVADSPDDQEFIRAVAREANLKYNLLEPVRRMVNTGSSFYRFFLQAGVIKSEWYNAKYCYPVFQPNGELQQVIIKYVWTDESEKDDLGNFVKKWFKMELNMDNEILYDNPKYEINKEPVFTVVAQVDHNLGFVQGEWLRTSHDSKSPDGYALVEDIMDFIDEVCYSLSQSSTSVSYNQDPQLVLNGMDETEVNNLIRSAAKSWNLGLKGEAKFLESELNGVKAAMELRDKVRLNIQDITRIVLLDPEKIVGNAQSGKAMEILHGPLKDLIDELRMPMEKSIKSIVQKMSLITLISNSRGDMIPVVIPPTWRPSSLTIECEWPPIFQQTIEDLQKKVNLVNTATAGNIISRKTGTTYLAKDFNIEDVDAELKEIAAQPIINPFGAF